MLMSFEVHWDPRRSGLSTSVGKRRKSIKVLSATTLSAKGFGAWSSTKAALAEFGKPYQQGDRPK
jgi:hypothetical protein